MEAKYTMDQREAMAEALVDRGIAANRIVELAAHGELRYKTEFLPPFETCESSVRNYARRMRQRRAGLIQTHTMNLPAKDAVEMLRRRLINVADGELARLERQRAGKVDPEKLRQVARAVREIASLPAPTEDRPPPPGKGPMADRAGGVTTGGPAGELLLAHRRSVPANGGGPPERAASPDHLDPGA